MTRGVRNNNPLNLRYNVRNNWQGRVLLKKDNDFEEFQSMYYGFRAAIRTIQNYILHHNCNTLAKIIARWAPPTENNTDNYIRTVALRSNVGGNENIAPNDTRIKTIIAQMAVIESGNEINDFLDQLDKAWADTPLITSQKRNSVRAQRVV